MKKVVAILLGLTFVVGFKPELAAAAVACKTQSETVVLHEFVTEIILPLRSRPTVDSWSFTSR